MKPAGKISIGNSITIIYALEVAGGKARFIGLDTSLITKGSINPKLQVEEADKSFGFLVKDTHQPELQMYIEPGLRSQLQQTSQQNFSARIAGIGNLNVTIDRKDGYYRVVKATIN